MADIPNQITYRQRTRAVAAAKPGKRKRPEAKPTKPTKVKFVGVEGPDGKLLTLAQLMGRKPMPRKPAAGGPNIPSKEPWLVPATEPEAVEPQSASLPVAAEPEAPPPGPMPSVIVSAAAPATIKTSTFDPLTGGYR